MCWVTQTRQSWCAPHSCDWSVIAVHMTVPIVQCAVLILPLICLLLGRMSCDRINQSNHAIHDVGGATPKSKALSSHDRVLGSAAHHAVPPRQDCVLLTADT